MALRKIVNKADPFMRKISRPVSEFNERLATMLDDMRETLIEVNGVGLAAVQVGTLRRVFITLVDDDTKEYINPEIVKLEGEIEMEEGCLSCPYERGVVKRPERVTVHAFDRNGKGFTLSADGLLARAIQHEYDHLDGVLFLDKADEIWDERYETEDKTEDEAE